MPIRTQGGIKCIIPKAYKKQLETLTVDNEQSSIYFNHLIKQ